MTIIYDSNCKFCVRFVSWAKSRNPDFVLLSNRDKDARLLLRSKGITFINLFTIYYVDSKVLIKSKAVFEILLNTKSHFKFLYVFRHLPTPFTDYFYNIISKYRYKL